MTDSHDEALARLSRLNDAAVDADAALDALRALDAQRGTGSFCDLALAALIKEAVLRLEAERGCVALCDPDGGLMAGPSYNFEPERFDGDAFATNRQVIAGVVESGRALVTTNVVNDPRFMQSMTAFSLRSIVAAPLVIDGELLGVLYLDNRPRSRMFKVGEEHALIDVITAALPQVRTALALDATRNGQPPDDPALVALWARLHD